MLFWSYWSLGWGAWWSVLSYSLIDGYSATGFTRPTDYDDDGNAFEGGVWNDWWPATILLALVSFAIGISAFREWKNEQ